MASSIVNFFKRKQNYKQQNGFENEQKFLHRGKAGTTSFRLPLYRKHSPPERIVAENAGDGNAQQNALPYKSPYDVVTEPKKKRAIRSCPGGSNHRNSGTFSIGKFGQRKFSPPIETILEQSGSYENFPPQPSRMDGEEKETTKCHQNQLIRKKVPLQTTTKPEQQHLPHAKRNMLEQATRNSPAHQQHQQQYDGQNGQHAHHNSHQHHQQMSTSEYGSGSTEPSPINEQFQGKNGQSVHQASFSMARSSNLPQYHQQDFHQNFRILADSSDGEEDDEDSSEEDRLSISFLQFWQHQVKLLKKEVRNYRESAEKYRSKYIRSKSRTEELSKELAKERERNISLFNQLLIANDKIVQLAQFQNEHQRNSGLTENGKHSHGNQHLMGQMNGGLPKFMIGRPFTLGGAGEVQCPINEVQGESNSSPAISDREFQFHHSSPLQIKQQPQYGQLFRPPPLFGNNTNSSFLNFSGLSADLGLETLRNEQQQNSEMFEKSSNFSPLKTVQQQDGTYQVTEDEPIIISLDHCIDSTFNKSEDMKEISQKGGMKTKFGRLSFSSDDLASLNSAREQKSNISSLLSSSDDDMAKLWTRQLVKKGERVLFRPPRRSLFVGSNDQNETAKPLKIFKRYGKSEREAMSTFNYLREEKSDVSGLMSSPEKAT